MPGVCGGLCLSVECFGGGGILLIWVDLGRVVFLALLAQVGLFVCLGLSFAQFLNKVSRLVCFRK